MNNNTLQLKFKQRLNKIDSQDYDNIKSWEIAEAFNKAQLEWCRRQLAGTNMRKEGDEMSKRRIDDLSLLLKTVKLEGVDVQYDANFGYFKCTNFASIYDPAYGGDYLEFKKVECAAQQCFPSEGTGYTPITETLDLTNTTSGYWLPDTSWSYEELFNLRIFTFTTNGNNSIDIDSATNNITDWGNYGAPGNQTPVIPPTPITTQQPWEHNLNEIGLWYSNGNPGDNVYNTNIIIPFHTGGDLLTACTYCGLTAGDILADVDLLSAVCNNAPSGYVVGGPHNEYIDCSEVPATFHHIPSLSGLGTINAIQYNYSNLENTWTNMVPNIFGIGDPCNLSQCWFVPTSVEIQTMSLNNFQTDAFPSPDTPVQNTAPDAWGNVDYALNPESTYVEPVETQYTIERATGGLTVDKCYCAPGTNPNNFCVVPRTMTVYQSEVANVDVILRDPLKRPDFEWCETFCTFQGIDNNGGPTAGLRIWRRNFYVMNPVLIYYRVPRRIEISGSVDPYTGNAVVADVISEFKDDIVEVIIDHAVSTLAGDISDSNQMLRGEQAGEKNN